MSQSTIRDNNNSFNRSNTNYFNVQNNWTVADDRSQLLTWLSPLEPRLRHRDVQERRVDNVGEWVMQTEEYGRWCDRGGEGGDEKPVLFCYGDPGVGKTFISSLVVDRLCDRAGGQNIAVTCFYFDFAARKEQSATNMLGSLLRQIISGMETIPEEISKAFEEQKKVIGGRAPQLSDLVRMAQTITSSHRTFICIDAMDECAAVHRVKILDSLNQILEKSPNTRIFVTGRPHIQPEIEKRLSRRVANMSIDPRKDDIIRYLRVRLAEDETPDAMDKSLEAEILQKIPENISEMFLLVSLNIEAILQESTIYQRREKLSKMADGLGLEDAYDATIERITAQGGGKSRLGLGALMWVSHAERPLTADELCHALAVDIGSTEFNASNLPSISTLVGYCQGLITVDKEASTVRLIHFTLQEYLSTHPNIFSCPHSKMAEICLTYLNSNQVKPISSGHTPRSQPGSFLEYCSVYWGVHARRELSDRAKLLAIKLLRRGYGRTSTKFLLRKLEIIHRRDTFSLFSGLHCASFFGIVETVAVLMVMEGYDINEGDFIGLTPLAWAAHNGHEGVVKMLLGRDEINPDKPDNFGRTPLLHAASNGHERVVEMLLGRQEVDPGKPCDDGCTPILCAAKQGHVRVVEILLGREEVDPDKPNHFGRTPLLGAADSGSEEVVRILLGREEVNPDEPDDEGQTPLFCAARNGNEVVVKILLGRQEVNPDKPDGSGRTPLSRAVWRGHEGVVKILLGRQEVDPDKPDNSGATPLSCAVLRGHEGVVKMLLGRQEVNPDKPDDDGRTPLSRAASSGKEVIVNILLRRQEVDPDKPDNSGRTPLLYAAWGGDEGVVKMLLARQEVNPDKPDKSGRTPLSRAAWGGHEGVVKMLLGRQEVNPHKPDNFGATPLSHASWGGHEGVVRMLLERQEVDPDKPDNSGRTPLLYATWCGHEGVVKMLLGRQEVNPDKPDKSGQTPLWRAASGGHEGVVRMLLGRQEVDPDKPDDSGRTPLLYAAWCGHEGVVKMLLGRQEVDPDKPDNSGATPLSCAVLRGREGVVKMLLGRQEVDPDKPDNSGRTPLSYAIRGGAKRVVALLQSRKAITPASIEA